MALTEIFTKSKKKTVYLLTISLLEQIGCEIHARLFFNNSI